MAPSQLKQLKASLRDSGVLGPQKSKQQKKVSSKDASKRVQRNAALESIRERFNPFEAKAPARREKFEVATNKPKKTSIERPGVTRGLGEERRRETLLKEMQSRNKVGGMMDRRFGENDPTMTPEEKAAERFARQAMRTSKKNSMFNLEDDDEEEMVLTHGGRLIDLEDEPKDDFQEDVSGSELDDFDGQNDRPIKRLRLDDNVEDGEEVDNQLPQRKKSKNEVMKEVMAKSKMYKAERQAAKADDDDLRAELDKGMGDFYEALRSQKPPIKQLPTPPHTDSEPMMDPGRAAMLAGKSREEADKEYEANVRRLQQEAKSKPSVRTKTEEEKATESAARLEELERARMRRMKGEVDSSDEEQEIEGDDEDEQDDALAFGLAQPQYPPRPELEVEDEDEFVFDDIVAGDSESELASDEEDSARETDLEGDGDDDFINGLVLPKATNVTTSSSETAKPSKNLAYTFPCPQTHAELLAVTESTKLSDLPTIVQRIRALYHKGLAEGNDEKQAKFAVVLVQHVAYLANSETEEQIYPVLEALIRHLHSMAKAQPEDVGLAFRDHLREIAEDRPLQLRPGDLMVLTAISTIFPTSDHFHTVVTPAMLTIARYLGQSSVQSFTDLATGAYCCSLAIQYQRLAKRVVPEVVTYIVNALAILASAPISVQQADPMNVPIRLPETSLRYSPQDKKSSQALKFDHLRLTKKAVALKATTLMQAFLKLSTQLAMLWQHKTALPELVKPVQAILKHLDGSTGETQLPDGLQKNVSETSSKITQICATVTEQRKPLLLHDHRPLAIKTAIPAFVENFNPDRHYDPDRERAEMAKLKAEHKKERKGAMRELRKDANFVAREQLREKKAKDEAYDKKFKRLVAEIQGEEGREAKEYEKEVRKRKGKY